MWNPTSGEIQTLQSELHLPINFKSADTWWWFELFEAYSMVKVKYSCVDWSFIILTIQQQLHGIFCISGF